MSENGETSAVLIEAHDLVVALIEGRLNPELGARLERLVCENTDVRKLYITYMHQRCQIAALAQPATAAPLPAESLHDAMVLEAISREAAQAGIGEPLPISRPMYVAPTPIRQRAVNPRRTWVVAAAAFLVLTTLIFFLSHQRSIPSAPTQAPVLATLTRTIDCHWSSAYSALAVGDGFTIPTTLSLSNGYAELTFASGAEVIVQAPADFRIQSNNSMSLLSGKVSATIPTPAHGFAVMTPQSVITDLGTEFGVQVGASDTEVDVFKGRVTARTPSAATQPALLTAGSAATIAGNGQVKVDPAGALPQHFVRELQTTAPYLDVVDLVSGGDGTTARRGPGIDPLTGNYGTLPPVGTIHAPPGFHRVAMTVLDGCFVPHGNGAQIDSAGHRFDFPRATGGTFNHISAGNTDDWPVQTVEGKPPLSVILGGVDYAATPHTFLLLHANSGLTFDLAAVAALHPGAALTGFHCLLGNPAKIDRSGKGATAMANAYVIVDGVARYQRLSFSNRQSPVVVDVPLTAADRFLTLASSHDGPNIMLDWIVFADPHFNLAHP